MASFTILYNSNGGTGTVTDTSNPYTSGSNVTIMSGGSVTKAGYTFVGWNTLSTGLGTTYQPNDLYKITANTTLYAKWTLSYSISYNSNGGSGTIIDPNSPYLTGSIATVMSGGSVSRTDYLFTGWNTVAAGTGIAYQPNSNITISSNVTLYAQWVNSYTVTYDSNGGSGTITDSNNPYPINSTVTLQSMDGFTKSGYVPVSWNTSPLGVGINYKPNSTFQITSNVTLYANWATAQRATFGDVSVNDTFRKSLVDELKPNGVDLLLPYEDFNSGWVQLAKGATVTVTHGFGTIPRLSQILSNGTATDNLSSVADGQDVTNSYSITGMTPTTVTIKNVCSTTTNKFFKLLLWR